MAHRMSSALRPKQVESRQASKKSFRNKLRAHKALQQRCRHTRECGFHDTPICGEAGRMNTTNYSYLSANTATQRPAGPKFKTNYKLQNAENSTRRLAGCANRGLMNPKGSNPNIHAFGPKYYTCHDLLGPCTIICGYLDALRKISTYRA